MNDQSDGLINMPVPLNLELDQWRRDIKTFSDTTRDALEAIVAELSNTCANHDLLADLPQKIRRQDAACQRVAEQASAALPIKPSPTPPPDDRLARLKLRLAQRLER